MRYAEFEIIAKKIQDLLKSIPKEWDGKKTILEMKSGGSNQWRQMEWIGFYFEYKVCNLLKSINFDDDNLKFKYGGVDLDGFFEIPWDVKTHVSNSGTKAVIVNDKAALLEAIKKHGCVGLIIGLGEAEFNDLDKSFRKWHAALKGEISKYVMEGKEIQRTSRLRKVHFSLEKIGYVMLDTELLENSGTFQKNFKNSDGNPRKEKVLLDLSILEEGKNVYYVDL